METREKLAQLRASEEKNRASCEGCRHDLGGGRDNCRINEAFECRDGGGFELYEAEGGDTDPEPPRKRKYTRRSRGEVMREFRRKNRLTQDAAGVLCRCSGGLIRMLEENDAEVTHPKIAARIARIFGMSERMAETLLPLNHRLGPGYDPERYIERDPNDSDYATIRLKVSGQEVKRHEGR